MTHIKIMSAKLPLWQFIVGVQNATVSVNINALKGLVPTTLSIHAFLHYVSKSILYFTYVLKNKF